MTRHKASMDWFANDGHCDLRVPCFVDFDDTKIKVVYRIDGEEQSYSGEDVTGHGHYSLRHDQGVGHGSLFGVLPKDSPGCTDAVPLKLEGSFVEGGYPGMWRVRINAKPE